MKAIIVALLMALISAFGHAQSPQPFDASLIGLPAEVFESAQSTVFTKVNKVNFEVVPVTTTKTFKGVTTKTVTYRLKLKPGPSGACAIMGLNHAFNYVHAFNYTYQGQNDTAFVFTNGNAKAYLKTFGNQHSWTTFPSYDDFGQFIGGKLMKFSRSTLDSLAKSSLGYGIDELCRRTAQVWTGTPVDPSIYVTSMFGVITQEGNTYHNHSLINGKLYSSFNYAALKWPWKDSAGNYKPLGDLLFSWVVNNECAVPAVKPTDANSTGNRGECFRRMYNTSQPQSKSITVTPGSAFSSNAQGNVTYDSSKKAAIELHVHWQPMPEKNTFHEGYWHLTGNTRVFTLQGL